MMHCGTPDSVRHEAADDRLSRTYPCIHSAPVKDCCSSIVVGRKYTAHIVIVLGEMSVFLVCLWKANRSVQRSVEDH